MKNRFLFLSSLLAACTSLFSSPIHLPGKQGWVSLFDGKSLKGWRTYQNRPSGSWSVNDGLLYCKGNKDGNKIHADLMTLGMYENFQLEIDWKIAPGANSGILYMVNENYPSSYLSGPEYQLLDDRGYPEKIEDYQKTGANYAMDAPTVDATKPAGEWNHTTIIVNKGHVEHWLNGKKVVEYELWTPTWQQHKAAGKWKDAVGYGATKSGHIALQDHGGEAWFKNIRIRKL
ncbi:MAG: DUF1080 domain-containing protein [Sediminibacterium sp.]